VAVDLCFSGVRTRMMVISPLPVRLDAWSAELGVVVPLAIGAMWYALGVRAIWLRTNARRGIRVRDATLLAAGILTLAIALISPLHEASEQLFTAHMIQHELLMVVAAPLLILGRPAVAMVWALPPRMRQFIGRVIHRSWWRRTWHALSRPFDAWLLHGVAIWVWHVPSLFQRTLTSDAFHAAQHISFIGTALLFWWAIFHPARRAALGLSIVYLFTTAVHTAVLGALMTFARTPWYPDYAGSAAAWGLTPLEDQQLAGLVMWVPASFAYLVAALIVLRRWLANSDWSVSRDERAAVAA
jgi:putative membrane protein